MTKLPPIWDRTASSLTRGRFLGRILDRPLTSPSPSPSTYVNFSDPRQHPLIQLIQHTCEHAHLLPNFDTHARARAHARTHTHTRHTLASTHTFSQISSKSSTPSSTFFSVRSISAACVCVCVCTLRARVCVCVPACLRAWKRVRVCWYADVCARGFTCG